VTRHLHLDPVTGVSGDMLLGALVDAGAPLDAIRTDLDLLGIADWKLSTERVTRHGLTGTLATVATADTAHHRDAAELTRIVTTAGLRPAVTERALAVLRRIAEVEAAIHGIPVEQVHFHEVGALDTLVDVVGVCSALDHLGVTSMTCTALPTGAGTVTTAHGELPVPVPAALALIAGTGIEWRFTDDPIELVTPTGAALVAEFARPALGATTDVTAVGYGFGQSTRLPRANHCRVVLGSPGAAGTDTVVRLGATIDDQSPEELAVAVERVLAAGAVDAWLAPVSMKKGRLGSDLTVLCRAADEQRIVDALFTHTTTLGVRRDTVARHVAERELVEVSVDGHTIRVKLRRRNGVLLGAKPELDDCAAAAVALGLTVESLRQRALAILQGG